MSPAPHSFDARLRFLRDLANLSQRELASLARLSSVHVCLLEREPPPGQTSHVEALTVLALARALGVTMDWLFAGVGDTPRYRQIQAAVERARIG